MDEEAEEERGGSAQSVAGATIVGSVSVLRSVSVVVRGPWGAY